MTIQEILAYCHSLFQRGSNLAMSLRRKDSLTLEENEEMSAKLASLPWTEIELPLLLYQGFWEQLQQGMNSLEDRWQGETQPPSFRSHFHLCNGYLSYYGEQWEAAISHCHQAKRTLQETGETSLAAEIYFISSLSLIELYVNSPVGIQRRILQKIIENQGKLQKCPSFEPHFWFLVRGEYKRLLGARDAALECYEKGIEGARNGGFRRDEALAYELTGRLYHEMGNELPARAYLMAAYGMYGGWGILAKRQFLQDHYPEILSPVTPQLSLEGEVATAPEITAAPSQPVAPPSLSPGVDWKRALVMLQGVGEDNTQGIVPQLLSLMLTQTEADQCALLISQGKGWQVAVVAPETDNFTEGKVWTPLSKHPELPQGLFEQVSHTQQWVGGDEVKEEWWGECLPDTLPKRVFCTPLVSGGKCLGLLYLENCFTAHRWSEDCRVLLEILAAQAALLLNDSQVSTQLEATSQELQQTKNQLVQGEKMLALGQLVSGITHEINNPIGFISGNLQLMEEYLRDLIEHLQLYQTRYPQPDLSIVQHGQEIDLEYLISDFLQLIHSMREGTQRIREISVSMRTFSRADTKRKVEYDLHEGLDNTVTILRHRLKADSHRPPIQVVKEYGDLPPVVCYPGQINQVFMNILANAIDALEESSQALSYQELEKHPPKIVIQTAVNPTSQQAVIRIRDNGGGIPPEIKRQIFDYLFTTKPAGKGTGLGLSISYQIITEKHQGRLICKSEVGVGTDFVIVLPL
ncbi:ATP-binding protein [Spirulina sp. CS-785/01]|uniref:ATP-binding protein n=1 Tax=Spirulina sp. CS-785/01 TaxID=3021716 RepID=UPI00232EAE3B|nr:ATP-binding protein [Spirulina sp. CS-785/01]MDB9312404.1 ATP-binding protein [Spirulina sp. CS-785/01]